MFQIVFVNSSNNLLIFFLVLQRSDMNFLILISLIKKPYPYFPGNCKCPRFHKIGPAEIVHQLLQISECHRWVICLLDLLYQTLYRNYHVCLFHQSELWGNLVLCHPHPNHPALASIAMSLPKVDFGNRSTWIAAICVNTITTFSTFALMPAKLTKSWYAAHLLLLYRSFLIKWILLFLKLYSCSFSNSFTFSGNLLF